MILSILTLKPKTRETNYKHLSRPRGPYPFHGSILTLGYVDDILFSPSIFWGRGWPCHLQRVIWRFQRLGSTRFCEVLVAVHDSGSDNPKCWFLASVLKWVFYRIYLEMYILIIRTVYFRVCRFSLFRYLFILSKWRQAAEVIVLVLLVLLASCAAINPTRGIAICRIFWTVSWINSRWAYTLPPTGDYKEDQLTHMSV